MMDLLLDRYANGEAALSVVGRGVAGTSSKRLSERIEKENNRAATEVRGDCDIPRRCRKQAQFLNIILVDL